MLFTLPNLFYFIFQILTIFFTKIRNIVTEFSLFIFRILAKFGTRYYVMQIYKEKEGSGYSDAFRGNYNGWE
jgi:hypothetical protein